MKKFVTLSLFVIFTFAAVACGTNSNPQPAGNTPAPTPAAAPSSVPAPVPAPTAGPSGATSTATNSNTGGVLLLKAPDLAFSDSFKKASYEYGLGSAEMKEMYADLVRGMMNAGKLNSVDLPTQAIEDNKAESSVVACANEKEMARRVTNLRIILKFRTQFENLAALMDKDGADFITENGEKCELTQANGKIEIIDIVALVAKEKAAALNI